MAPDGSLRPSWTVRHPRRSLIAVVVLIAAAVLLALYLRSGDAEEQWPTLSDDASGITVAHPPGWRVQRTRSLCRRVGPGVLVSNVPSHTFRTVAIPNGCTNRWDFKGLPPRYVVVDASLWFPPGFSGEGPDTPTPLRLFFDSEGDRFASRNVKRNGYLYSVRVWYGPSASHADQEAAARLVRSLDFHPRGSR